ncbi:hypothetical protein [Maioricimonas rarisocia]|nr:hypothetical protein [Maioricimonas rarisocia]
MRGTEFGRKQGILALLAPAVCVSGIAVSGCARSRDVAVARPEPAAEQQRDADADAAQDRRDLVARDDAVQHADSEAEVRRSGWRRWLSGGSSKETKVAEQTTTKRRSFPQLFADNQKQDASSDPFLKSDTVQTASASEAEPTPGVPTQSEPPVQTAQAETPAIAATPGAPAAPAHSGEASQEIWNSLMSPPNATEQAALSRAAGPGAATMGAGPDARPFPQETVSRTDRLRAEVAATESALAPRPTPKAPVTEVRFSTASQEKTRTRVDRLIAQAYRQDAAGDTTGAMRSLERAIELCNYGGLTFGPNEDNPRDLKRKIEAGLRIVSQREREAKAEPAEAAAEPFAAQPNPVRQADFGTDSLADEVFDDVFGQHQWRRASEASGDESLAVPPQSEPAAGEVDDARPFPTEPPADPLSAQAEPEAAGEAELSGSPIQLAGISDVDEDEEVVRHAVVEQADTETLRRVQTVSEESVQLTSPLLAEGSLPEFPSRSEQPTPEPLVQLDQQPLFVAPPPPVETTADRSSRLESGAGAKPGESRSGRSPVVQVIMILLGIAGGLGLLFRRRGQKTPTPM